MSEVKISDAEIQDLPYRLGGEIDLMNLYRKKGVPIKGTFNPTLDTKNYIYKTYHDDASCYKVVEWTKK